MNTKVSETQETAQAQAPVNMGTLAIITNKLYEPDTVKAIASRYEISEDRAKTAISNVLSVIVNADEGTNLQQCSPNSIATAMKDSATLGLYIDTRQHAHLIARWNGKKNVHEAKLQIGYRGYIYKLHQHFDSIDVQVFIVEDVKDFVYGSKSGLAWYDFNPQNPFFDEYAKADGAFCYISYMVGGREKSVIEPLPQSEIKKIRAAAKTQKFWNQWAGEKIKVAAIRRACKHRFAAIVEDLDAHDNEDYDMNAPATAETSGEGISSSLKDTLRKERESNEPKKDVPVTDAEYEEVEESDSGEPPVNTASAEASATPDDDAPMVDSVTPVAAEVPEESLSEDSGPSGIIPDWDGKTIETGSEPFVGKWDGHLHAYNFLIQGLAKIEQFEERQRVLRMNLPFTNFLVKNDLLDEYNALNEMCNGERDEHEHN